MALIKCPECGENISDKSQTCIHCGFPINQTTDTSTKSYALRISYFEEGVLKYNKIFKICKEVSEKSFISYQVVEKELYEGDFNNNLKQTPFIAYHGLTKDNAEWLCKIFRRNNATVSVVEDNSSTDNPINNAISKLTSKVLCCPRCGSSDVVIGQRGVSLLWGFLGSNKTTNRCGKCGYMWQPK